MDLISFDAASKRLGLKSRISKIVLSWTFSFFKINEFNDRYNQLNNNHGIAFIDAVIQYLRLKIKFDETLIEKIPAKGPFIIIANHPHGIIDGLVLLKLISIKRPEVKVVVNDLLENIDPLNEFFLPVKKVSDSTDIYNNGKKILGAIKHEIPLIFFPAGSVSHFQINKMKVQDKPWDETAIKFISKAKAPILPFFIKGSNSWLYHFLYNTFIKLSLICLIREFFKLKDSTIEVSIGDLFSIDEIPKVQLQAALRKKVYSLSERRSE